MMHGASPGSLRVRLLAGTLAWVLVTVALAGFGLRRLFEDHIAQQLERQLVIQLDHLSAAVAVEANGAISVGPMATDPRSSEPLSGVYWQVDRLGDQPQAAAVRSRSLWDEILRLPPPPASLPATGYRVLHLEDSRGHPLLAVARTLQLPEDNAPLLRVAVAADTALVAEPVARFTNLLLVALTVLGAGLVVTVAVQLRLVMRPLDALRERLGAVRRGDAAQLEGRFPQELQPLVDEFNHVLEANAGMVERARTQAGNLAHAVHTPLTVLANAAAQEKGPLAQLVQEQVATAHRQVDYHLARARAAAAVRATGLHAPVLPPVQALLRTMERLHAGRAVTFHLDPQAVDGAFRGEEQDLYELLGNLLDNAGKWAHSRVDIDVQRHNDQLCITVDDDGPGIPADQRERMFERGVQLDERRPGSGLGLDIVRELAHAYGGSVAADVSPRGGLRMRLFLPAAN